MKYLDKRDNADILARIRRRYLIKGAVSAALSLVFVLSFLLLGFSAFADRFGIGNAGTVVFLLAILPVFLTGMDREIADRSWEGVVVSARKVIVKKREKLTAADHLDPYTDFIKLIIELPDGGKKTLFEPIDELYRFPKGSRIRHIRGTKYPQLLLAERAFTDCVMCGKTAEKTDSSCPHCGYSLIHYTEPAETEETL